MRCSCRLYKSVCVCECVWNVCLEMRPLISLHDKSYIPLCWACCWGSNWHLGRNDTVRFIPGVKPTCGNVQNNIAAFCFDPSPQERSNLCSRKEWCRVGILGCRLRKDGRQLGGRNNNRSVFCGVFSRRWMCVSLWVSLCTRSVTVPPLRRPSCQLRPCSPPTAPCL